MDCLSSTSSGASVLNVVELVVVYNSISISLKVEMRKIHF
jgi:hypothetical protein